MMMTNAEIAKSFANRGGTAQSQIRILSELNGVPKETIKDILLAQGFTPEEINTRGHYKKKKQWKAEEDMAIVISAASGAAIDDVKATGKDVPGVTTVLKMPESVKSVLKAHLQALDDEISKLECQKEEISNYIKATEAAEV